MSISLSRRALFAMVASCPLCARAFAAEADSCVPGQQQSPIVLGPGVAVKADVPMPEIVHEAMPFDVKPEAGTFKCYPTKPGNKLTIGGVEYKLKEFHFHHPAEHKLPNDPYQMECHLVHEPADPVEPCAPVQYAVIAVFISPGRILNKALSPVWRKIKPNTEGGVTANPVDLRHLVPNKERRTPVYRYMGSLTTGDEVAKEGIMWTIFEKPVEAFQLQIDQFTRNYPVNARKTRPLYRRFLLAKTR